MKFLELLVVIAFFASLAALALLSYFQPLYGLPGIVLDIVVFALLVALIRRSNRPSSAKIAAMRIRH